MNAERSPLPHALPARLQNLQSAYEALLSLARRQYACIQSDDIAGLHRVLDRKATLIAEIDSHCGSLMSEIGHLDKCLPPAETLAQWQDEVRRLLSEIDAVDRRSVLALEQRLIEGRAGFAALAQARKLLTAYRQTSSAPHRHRYVNRCL